MQIEVALVACSYFQFLFRYGVNLLFFYLRLFMGEILGFVLNLSFFPRSLGGFRGCRFTFTSLLNRSGKQRGTHSWILAAGNKTHQEHPWDAKPCLKGVVNHGKQ